MHGSLLLLKINAFSLHLLFHATARLSSDVMEHVIRNKALQQTWMAWHVMTRQTHSTADTFCNSAILPRTAVACQDQGIFQKQKCRQGKWQT